MDGGFIQTPHHASQRLDQCSILISHVGRDLVHVAFDNSGRDAGVLGVSAVVEKKIVTKVFIPALAIETLHARSRVSRYYSLTYMETFHFRTHGDNIARQLVPKQRGWNDHAGVVTATEHLHVGTARDGS